MYQVKESEKFGKDTGAGMIHEPVFEAYNPFRRFVKEYVWRNMKK